MPRKKTILIIDNDKVTSSYLGIILKRMGFDVSYADGGADARELYRYADIQLMLVDADMSMPDGTATLLDIRKTPEFFMTPVIMLSSSRDEPLVKRLAVSGAHGVLFKPVGMDDLYEILQDFVFGYSGVRRKLMRVNARVKVMVTRDGETRRFTTESVSEGGLYLRTDDPYPVDAKLEVSLPAPDRDLKLKAKVIFHGGMRSGASVPPGMAVQFVGLREDESLSLTRLVNELMTGDLGSGSEGTVSHGINSDNPGLGTKRGAA